MKVQMKVKLLRECAVMPEYKSEGAAALDLCYAGSEPIEIAPHERVLVPTGVAISIPADHVAILCARSGTAFKKGITAANGIGVIDSDYRGEIFFAALNTQDKAVTLEAGERIAQLMLVPVSQAEISLVSELDSTERGAGGFGSTGSK